MKKNILFFASTLLIGIVAGLLIAVRLDVFAPLQSEDIKSETSTLEGFNIEDAVINVAGTTGKAVVSISAEQTTRIQGSRRYYFGYPHRGGQSPSIEDDSLRSFFDQFFPEMPDREYKQLGLGSGVIIDPEGYVLTNEHVVGNADKITVTLSDGREFKGEVKGRDQRADLAVIKISARNLPAAKLGDSDNIKIGQWVVAIGNPFGFALQNPEPTVTIGVISALHRSLGRTVLWDKDYNDLIQTDAAINPGNSGGPLVNLKGEIVGINVAIFSTSGGYQGVGFAIPANNAKRIISRLIAGKKVLYGWLGVSVQDLSDDLAKYFNLSDKNGALVVQVMEKGPAEKAGMHEGDIIIKFDNQPINNVKGLLSIVGRAEVGYKAKAVVIRGNKELSLGIEVGERPENPEEISKVDTGITAGWRGLGVEGLTPENIRRFGIQEKEGLVAVNIAADSPAEESGIIPGDVILEINRQSVKNVSDYEMITRELKGNALVKTARGYFLVKAQ